MTTPHPHFNSPPHPSFTKPPPPSPPVPCIHAAVSTVRKSCKNHKSKERPQLSCHTPSPASPSQSPLLPHRHPLILLDLLPIKVHQTRQKSRVTSSIFPHHPTSPPLISQICSHHSLNPTPTGSQGRRKVSWLNVSLSHPGLKLC